ncbi:signal transduction histidine kinase [Pseudonocardia sediminis]|uniref:histidine kinase n=1 Tax=Pseudonocardia sediminis TaxID=1397368 RepID=A0A4Q7V157_PSEST|nr:sensor domain-containing protein [Pseudonocardia sediminis]RZT86279.1 signal transduction histidine kinase [Pseudonocardia sediminis]
MRVATAWQAMDQRPLRFLATAWPWRALGYLLSGVIVGGVVVAAAVIGVSGIVVPLMVPAGLLLLTVWALCGPAVARLERWRLRLVDLDPVPDPHRAPFERGVRALLSTRLRERATRREAGYALLTLVLSCLDAVVLGIAFVLPVSMFLSPVDDPRAWPAVIVGVVLLLAAPYTVTAWAGARATLARTVLGPRDAELGAELTDVAASRRRLVDAFEAERARIERDLHDGAQQRLVSVSMALGLARLDADDGSPVAHRLDDARTELTAALAELRDLVRGLNPQVLKDNGLVAALEDSAGRSPVPTTVDVSLPRRLPPHVEVTAYFVATEAMTNVARHSGATAARLHGRHQADTLLLEISDNGVGGATPGGRALDSRAPGSGEPGGREPGGTGLAGLAERLTAADGRLRLSSPPGGPTLLRAEIPCRFE